MLSQTLTRSPEIVAVVRDAVAMLPVLIDELEYGSPPVGAADGIAARADAISGREGGALPTAAPSPAPLAAVETGEMAPVAATEPAPAPATEVDPVLQDIFRKETVGHVAAVRDYIQRRSQDPAPHPVTEDLYRACHTLSGIAKTAGVRQGIKVAEPMEHYIRKLHDVGHGLPAEGLSLLKDTLRALENVVDHFDEDTGFFPDHRRLIVGWHGLERSLDGELARLSAPAESPSIPPGSAEFAVADAGDSPGGARSSDDQYDVELPAVDVEFDADIAGIFSEEASELLEQADAVLGRWRRDRADAGSVIELKRILHTLKGGARMAGLRAMGDLSHEMESALESFESGAAPADTQAIAVLQAALDALHQMRDAAGGGQAMAPTAALIERIRAIGASQRPAAPVAPPAAVVPRRADARRTAPGRCHAARGRIAAGHDATARGGRACGDAGPSARSRAARSADRLGGSGGARRDQRDPRDGARPAGARAGRRRRAAGARTRRRGASGRVAQQLRRGEHLPRAR